LNTIINSEIKINEMRKSFWFIINAIFTESLYFFGFKDYITYLKNYQLLDESLNIDLFFIRIDKNRNEKNYFIELDDKYEYYINFK
jgi:hypothetical protein